MNREGRRVKGPKLSKLCRKVTKDGWDLDIRIFADGKGKWRLEVVNDTNSASCWTEPFDTEQEALDEALKTIEREGIEGFHVSQPWREH